MEHISQLLYKHLRGTLNEAEEAELMGWAAADPANRALLERVGDGERLDADLAEWYAIPRRSVADDPRLDAEITAHERSGKPKRMRRWLPYVAAALLVASVVGWLVVSDRWAVFGDRQLAATEIGPGGNRATLTLADGRTINLDEAQTGIIVGAEDITYQDGVSLGLSPAGGGRDGQSDGRGRSEDIEMLALTTPKGGTYQITLPDGSKIWLNANSTLKYPSRFRGDTREVILEGEAYFSVTGIISHLEGGRGVTRTPFKVMTSGQTIEVLGTQFNISAYADDPETRTTLVGGKVKVTPGTQKGSPQKGLSDFRTSGLSDYVLTPGQQAITRGAATTITEVDTEQYASWKDGFFYLEGTVPAILREISRWYDVEVVYEQEINDPVNLAITFPRDRALGDVLHVLQRAVPAMRYRVEEIKRSNERNVEQRAERRLTISR